MAEGKRKTPAHIFLTVDDVARKAGVSRTAVSYVLNEHGQKNKHVSDTTREKVLQAAQALNYQSHTMARALRKGYSEEVVLLMDTASPAVTGFITSVQQQALVYGYTPVMYLSHGLSAEEKRALYESIYARHPIGIIASPFTFTAEDAARAAQMGVKHSIFIGFHTEPIEQSHSIVFPSWALGYLATQHLLERGHRRLALVQPDHMPKSEAFLQRLAGMHAAIAEKVGVTIEVLPLHLSASAARTLVETIFVGDDRPTGIYAFNDEYAVVVLGALTRLGIRAPQDVAVVGTDNLPVGEYVWPTLTSMCFDTLDVGKRAVVMLHTLHEGLQLPEELTRPLVPQLLLREST